MYNNSDLTVIGRFLTERSTSFLTDFNAYKNELFLVKYGVTCFYRIKCDSNGKTEPIYLCCMPELFSLAFCGHLAYDMVCEVFVYE